MKTDIRKEEPGDEDAIRNVVFRAFQSQSEPRLVDRLRDEDAAELSLVAVVDNKIVGHILFSPMTLDPENPAIIDRVFGLAPLSVLPEFQNAGIGTKLVQRGLSLGISMRWRLAFVLGDPAFYSRFNFKQASKFNYYTEYDAPDEAFMVVSLDAYGLSVGPATIAKYHSVFSEVGI